MLHLHYCTIITYPIMSYIIWHYRIIEYDIMLALLAAKLINLCTFEVSSRTMGDAHIGQRVY